MAKAAEIIGGPLQALSHLRERSWSYARLLGWGAISDFIPVSRHSSQKFSKGKLGIDVLKTFVLGYINLCYN